MRRRPDEQGWARSPAGRRPYGTAGAKKKAPTLSGGTSFGELFPAVTYSPRRTPLVPSAVKGSSVFGMGTGGSLLPSYTGTWDVPYNIALRLNDSQIKDLHRNSPKLIKRRILSAIPSTESGYLRPLHQLSARIFFLQNDLSAVSHFRAVYGIVTGHLRKATHSTCKRQLYAHEPEGGWSALRLISTQ